MARPVLLSVGRDRYWLRSAALASDLTSLYLYIWGGHMAGSIAAAFAYMADIKAETNRAKVWDFNALRAWFHCRASNWCLLAGSDPSVTNFAILLCGCRLR